MADTSTQAVYLCECGSRVPLRDDDRVGDSLECRGCGRTRILIRSKIDGPFPDTFLQGRNLTPSERLDVELAWDNIRERRKEQRAQRITLTRSNLIFALGLLGVYMAGILVYQNLMALGKATRARRALVLSVASYIALLGTLALLQPYLANWELWALILGYSFAGSLILTLSQVKDALRGLEDGAVYQFPLIPSLIAIAVLLAEFFLARAFTSTLLF